MLRCCKRVSDEAEIDALAKQLWALGDLARLRLLSLLPEQSNCEGRNNVSQLAERMGLSQPTISHHLRVLRQAGLVEFTKRCRDVYYWRNEAAITEVANQLNRVLGDHDAVQTDVAAGASQ